MQSTITRSLRQFRSYHRYLGLALALLLLLSALTGILLAWKKQSDLLQPPTQKGAQPGLVEWLPLDQLGEIAQSALLKEGMELEDAVIDRMDIRPGKGIVKILFKEGWWEVQVDGTSGKVLSIARRHSDWIEKVHDGSIISEGFKLLSMNILGFGILLLITTGIWLWYGPRLFRKLRRK